MADLVRRVLAAEAVTRPAEMSIVLTDEVTVQGLNSRYLGLDEPTDVLSFPFGDALSGAAFISPPGLAHCLGEVIISYPTAQRQAEEGERSVAAELAHLLVHGLLHILGYDHGEPEDERRMRQREEELLAGWRH